MAASGKNNSRLDRARLRAAFPVAPVNACRKLNLMMAA